MWAVIRLLRASAVFGLVFASYAVQLVLARLLRRPWVLRRWAAVHEANADRLLAAFVRLRGVYIKLGQILSLMGNWLPPVYAKKLEALQDEVPPRPYREIARALERSLGARPEVAFARFETEALAAASLGQVHEAWTHDGEHVAVKLLYPDIKTIIAIDLRVLGWALWVYRRFVPVRQLDRVHAQLEDMLRRETDYHHEARCIARMAAAFADDPDVALPRVLPALSTDAVLTMTFMDGVKISRAQELAAIGLDPVAVATKLIKVFYKQLFVDRFFHADPHPGNFFVRRGPAGEVRIVILDLGSASELRPPLADGMLDVLGGTMARDDRQVLRGIERMGFVAADGDRALLERVARQYFEKLLHLTLADFQQPAQGLVRELDPGLGRRELRALMASIEYPLGWFDVERALVIMFALCLQLAPRMNTLEVGFPYVMQFIADQTRARAAASATTPPA